MSECPACEGKGKHMGMECPLCKGSGRGMDTVLGAMGEGRESPPSRALGDGDVVAGERIIHYSSDAASSMDYSSDMCGSYIGGSDADD